MNQFNAPSPGAYGESQRNKKAAKRGEFTIHPSSIDLKNPQGEPGAYPKMLYIRAGVTADDQIIVFDEDDLRTKEAQGYRRTVLAPMPSAPILSVPVGEVVAAKKRGRPKTPVTA